MLDIFTVVWGKMVSSFLGATLPSLLWPNNIPAARPLLGTYTIYSDPPSRSRILRHAAYKKLAEVMEIEWEPLQKGRGEVTSNIVCQMEKSLTKGNYMLVMSPDWVLGNGSLRNMAELCAKGKHNPVLYGFPRVTEVGWKLLLEGIRQGQVLSNRHLVSLATKHLEQVTYPLDQGVLGYKEGGPWIVSGNTWSVRHNVPTPCLRPDTQLLEIFKTNSTINSGYDHATPYIMVELGYSWYIVPHSDVYFQVERGKHIIQEQVVDLGGWQKVKALKGLEFFGEKEAIWQGV